MNNKMAAKHALAFLGGKPKVDRFYNVDESKSMDVMTSVDGEIKGISTCVTIGLNAVDIGMVSRGKKIRVELIAAGTVDAEILGNILSSMAFDIIDTESCAYGMVVPNVVKAYIPHTHLKHMVLLSPVFWKKYTNMEDESTVVTWLFAVPISDEEKKYIETFGIELFDKLIGDRGTDVLNWARSSEL